MATSKSLANCININALETRDKLPESIKLAAKAGRKDLMVVALDKHMEALESRRKSILEQHNAVLDKITSNSTASKITNRKDDEQNELNTFRPVTGKKLAKNLVQRAGNFSSALRNWLPKKDGVTPEDIETLTHFNENFHGKAVKSIQKLFQYKEGTSNRYRGEDPIQFIPQRKKVSVKTDKGKDGVKDIWVLDPVTYTDADGELLRNSQGTLIASSFDPAVSAAIASAAYEWLGTEGARKALGQTPDSIRSMLGLDKDDPVPEVASRYLDETGVNTESLAAALGKSIFKRMSITDTPDSDAMAKSSMEMSLGLMAVAMLEDTGYIKSQEVFHGGSDGETGSLIGLAALKRGEEPADGKVFYEPDVDENGVDRNSREGTPTVKLSMLNFTRDPSNKNRLLPSEEVAEIKEKMNLGPDAFSKIFGDEQESRGINWGVVKTPKTMKIGRTGEEANKTQTENITKYSETLWNRSAPTLDLFEAMLALDPKAEGVFGKMLGKESGEGKLNLREKSLAGINRSIDRDVEAVSDWINQAKERREAGKPTSFSMPSVFMSTMRMLQRGPINPQNSKLARTLFSPEGWGASFSPNYSKKDLTKKEGMERSFHESIADAFNIESGHVGGPEKQLRALDNLLRRPDRLDDKGRKKSAAIVDALTAIGEFNSSGNMTPELMQSIAAGVEATGNKAHGLKGLVEYARYQKHQDTPAKDRKDFTTDMYRELDGISNGVIIGLIQFIPHGADKQTLLSMLAMGGMSINTNKADVDKLLGQKNLNDAYQRMGQIWALSTAQLKENLHDQIKTAPTSKERNQARREYEWAQALGGILGKFQDAGGVIEKAVRNMSKPRTMQTQYGAGNRKQSQILATSDVINDKIYGKIEEFLVNEEKKTRGQIKSEFSGLLGNVNTLIGKNKYHIDSYLDADGQLSREIMSGFKLNPAEVKSIETAVRRTYGKSMQTAIDKLYGPMIDSRKPLNDAVQLAVTVYNKVFETKVNAQIELKRLENKDTTKKEFTLTNRELDAILGEIEHLLPKIKTPIHLDEDPSYLPLFTRGKSKSYGQEKLVKQIYAPGTRPRHKGYAEGIPFLDPPSVSALVKSIQMLDAMGANKLMSTGIPMLNNHDGFSHSIKDSEAVRDKLNQDFYDIHNEYDLAAEFSDMNAELTAAGAKALYESGVPGDSIFDSMVDDGLISVEVAAQLTNSDIGSVKRAIEAEQSSKVSRKEATDKVIRTLLLDENKDQMVEGVFEILEDKLQTTARVLTTNKKIFMNAVTHSAQYPYRGEGVDITPKTDSDTIFGTVKVNKVTSIDAQNTDADIGTMKEFVGTAYESSPDSENVSTSINDYPDSTKVDSLNATQVLESIIDLDNQAKHASIQDSADHVSHLARVMDSIVSKVMTPVEVFKREHQLDKETMGKYTVDEESGNKIWIQTQKLSTHPKPGMLGHGIRMSAAEVYAHEMVHHITHTGLKTSSYLQKQAADLYALAEKAFVDKYGANAFRVFMQDPDADLSDAANSFEIIAAKARWTHIFGADVDGEGKNQGLDEFVAIGMTNENFKRELAQLEVPVKVPKSLREMFEQDLQTTLVNLFDRIMDFIQHTFRKQEHSTRADLELENLVRAISESESRKKSTLYQAYVSADKTLTALSVKMDDKFKDLSVKTMDKTQIGQLISKMKQLPELNNMISHQIRKTLLWYNDSEQGLIASLNSEIQGTTERLKPLHTLLNHSKRVIDHAKNEAAGTIRDAVNSWFEEELDSKTKSAITKVIMKSDLSSMIDKASPGAIMGFLSSETQREDKIKSLLREIADDPELAPHRHFFEKAADDLGYYMITSSGRTSHGKVVGTPLMNARNIALMKGLPAADSLQGDAFDKAVDKIDQLATLSSLRYVQEAQKSLVLDQMNKNWKAMKNIMYHHNLVKEAALKDTFQNAESLMQKGYTKQILNARIQYEQGTEDDKDAYERMGWTMQATPIKRDPNDPVQEDIYMFKSNLGTVNDLQSGIASNIKNGAKGTTMYHIQQQVGNKVNPSAVGDANNRKVVAALKKRLAEMYSAAPRDPNLRAGSQNALVPKFDATGKVSEMRYVMNEHTKDTVLEQHSEFDAVLGAMTSQTVEKVAGPKINAELITVLKDLYDKEYSKYPEAYVDISPYSDNKRYRDIYHMLPDKTKVQIESVWGRKGMMVAQDVIDVSFGQRQYTVSNIFSKDKREMRIFERLAHETMVFAFGYNNPFSKSPLNATATDDAATKQNKQVGRASNRAKRVEEAAIQLTQLAKSNIVVRNIRVTYGNHLSNMAYLKSKGITSERIVTLSREAFSTSLQYQKDKSELNLLESRRRVIERDTSLNSGDKARQLRNMDRRIKRLNNDLARNPSTLMIDSGLMPKVVDDVSTDSVQSPHKYGLDAGLDNVLGKLPSKLEKAGRVIFMTEDTEGYKILNNSVKMTDYVARYVLYHHYIKQGVEHDDAVSSVMSEYINFDLPTHNKIDYLNRVGIVWFSKYQLRVLKPIKNLLTEHAFSTLSTFILSSFIGGNNILQSIPGITKDIGQGFGNAASTFMGTPGDILYADMVESAAQTILD